MPGIDIDLYLDENLGLKTGIDAFENWEGSCNFGDGEGQIGNAKIDLIQRVKFAEGAALMIDFVQP